MIGNTPVIAFVSHKPGVGKTTAAFLMAYYYAITGKKVMYGDGDHTSQSGATWQRKADARGGSKIPFRRISVAHAGILEETEEQLTDEDVAILDIGGGDTEIAKLAAQKADIVIIATTMSPFDTEHVPTMSKEIDSAIRNADRDESDVQKLLLFGRYDRRRVNSRETLKDAFSARGIDIIDAALPNLVDFENVKNHHPGDFGLDMSPVKLLGEEVGSLLW